MALLAALCASATPMAAAGASSPLPSPGPDPVAIATQFLGAIASGNAAAAEPLESAEMRAAAPAAALEQLWDSLAAQYGPFQSFGSSATSTSTPPFTSVAVPVEFANATVELVVVLSATGEVGGLHLGQVTPNPSASPGAVAPTPQSSPVEYVDPSAFTERDVTVGSAPWALPGTLSVPNRAALLPAVVLVGGSGPEDRDETIGPNKPMRDIAWGLASQGIAVLRYDKRTLVYAQQMASVQDITVHEETMDDAAAAIALLRSTAGIDPNRVFLVGHSLGGHLAPRTAAMLPGQLAGIGMLEANSTPLAELILHQVEYLASLPDASPATKQALEDLRPRVELAMSPELSPTTPATELPFNTPASYWLDLQAYDAASTAGSLAIPEFFSQGGRDYQVPPTELVPYQAAVAGRTDVQFHQYPALNHLLLAGTGPATPSEYSVPGHVDSALVADLAAWVGAP